MQPDTLAQNGTKQAPTPVEQWDQVAFKLIQDILAPDGYKQIKNGHWRGLRIANAVQPGVVKSKVNQCQKVAAQMVRTYRGKAQRAVQEELETAINQLELAKTNYKSIPFWRFARRKRYYRLANSYAGRADAFQEVLGILLQQGIK